MEACFSVWTVYSERGAKPFARAKTIDVVHIEGEDNEELIRNGIRLFRQLYLIEEPRNQWSWSVEDRGYLVRFAFEMEGMGPGPFQGTDKTVVEFEFIRLPETVASLRASVREASDALSVIEWSMRGRCPMCLCTRKEDHSPSCSVRAAQTAIGAVRVFANAVAEDPHARG